MSKTWNRDQHPNYPAANIRLLEQTRAFRRLVSKRNLRAGTVGAKGTTGK